MATTSISKISNTSSSATFASHFPSFHVFDVNYKLIGCVAIPASVLIPRDIKPGRRPVLVRWHGGCFVTGHRLYPRWFGDWSLNFALSKSAIVISPDYRLMPEASGSDILEDISDFFEWLATSGNLVSILPEGVEPDLEHVLVMGESAGGWLAIQSGLLPRCRDRIAAIIARYPMIDLHDEHYTSDHEKMLFDPPVAQIERHVLRDHLDGLTGNEIVTSGIPPERVPLVHSALQQGVYDEWFGKDRALYPIEMIDHVTAVPPTWILHGTEDSVVPIKGSSRYVSKLMKSIPHAILHTSYRAGTHGFDNTSATTMDDAWICEGIAFIDAYWPKC